MQDSAIVNANELNHLLKTDKSEKIKNSELLKNPENLEEFKKHVSTLAKKNKDTLYKDFNKGILHLNNYSGVKKYRSIRRAIRRGHVSIFGDVYPNRPFKNIESKKGNITYKKKRYYEQLKHRNRQYA